MVDRSPAASNRDHQRIRLVLLTGLVIAVAAMTVGFVVDLLEGERVAVAVPLRSIFGVGSVGDRIMAFGILVLVLTPVARVVALIGVWWRERDRRFVLVGATVLVILVVGMIAGLG
jgi:uncharacterized membrane protein